MKQDYEANITNPWSENEYIYIDEIPHCYTKYKHLFLVHFRGGRTIDLSALGNEEVRMPKNERLPIYISPMLMDVYEHYCSLFPKVEAE